MLQDVEIGRGNLLSIKVFDHYSSVSFSPIFRFLIVVDTFKF